MKDSLKKAKFLEIDCDEIPVPFAVLQRYWVVQNLHFVMIFRASRTNCYCGDWVLHVILPLTSCDFCSQILSVYERWTEVFFFFFFWLFLIRMRGNLLIYRKMSIFRFLWGDRWKLHANITPSWQRTCLWQMTGVRIVSCRSADFNMFQMTYKYNSVSSEDIGPLKFPWKKVQHSESGWYAHDLRYMFVFTSSSPPWRLINCF